MRGGAERAVGRAGIGGIVEAAQRVLHAAHGHHQLADLVHLRGAHLVGQIAAGDALGERAGLGQRSARLFEIEIGRRVTFQVVE